MYQDRTTRARVCTVRYLTVRCMRAVLVRFVPHSCTHTHTGGPCRGLKTASTPHRACWVPWRQETLLLAILASVACAVHQATPNTVNVGCLRVMQDYAWLLLLLPRSWPLVLSFSHSLLLTPRLGAWCSLQCGWKDCVGPVLPLRRPFCVARQSVIPYKVRFVCR